MRLFIPRLGQELTLASRWEFNLYPETRNKSLWDKLGLDYHEFAENRRWIPYQERTWQGPPYTRLLREERTVPFILDAGTVLKVERIFIRKGAEKFDSVTFSFQREQDKRRCRFWVKLDDANKIEV